MNTMVKELLNRQGNERVEMATLLVSRTKEMLTELGCPDMLSTTQAIDTSKYEIVINNLKAELEEAKNNVKTVEVETIKEVIKEVPVEIVKEVEVIKEVEVVKEIPVETVKEVKVESDKDKAMIKELMSKVNALELKLKAKDELITKLTTVKTNPVVPQETKISTKETPAMPVSITVNEDMLVLKNAKTWLFGTYKGVAFQSSKNIVGTVIFDSNNYGMKDKIEKLLLEHKLISKYRDVKDPVRIESKLGVCHKIDANTYTGFVHVGTVQHCFTWRVSKESSPATLILKKRLENANYKFEKCVNASVISKIRLLVEKHKEAETTYTKELMNANKNVTVDTKKQAEEHKARLAALKMAGAPKTNAVINTAPVVNNTPVAPVTNESVDNAPDLFAGLDFGFGDE